MATMTGSKRWLAGALLAVMATASSALAAGTHQGPAGAGQKARIASPAVAKPAPAARPLTPPSAEVAPGFRAHFGHSDVYIASFFQPVGGAYDLVVHFHGLKAAQESNIERTQLNAVIVSVNLGAGSGPYEEAFKDPRAFGALIANVERIVAKSGRAPDAHLGRIALSAWSAGYGSVSAILRNAAWTARIDAVLLADGLHSDYQNEKKHIVDDRPIAKYARVAEAAKRGEKLFALTHSSILTQGYPTAGETIGELLKLTSVAKAPNAADGPRGMREIYESNSGDFHVKGYQGIGVKDHINHIWGMNETLLPYLKERWSR